MPEILLQLTDLHGEAFDLDIWVLVVDKMVKSTLVTDYFPQPKE